MRFFQRCLLAGLPIIATLGVLIWVCTILDGFLATPQKYLFKFLFNSEITIPGLGLLFILLLTVVTGFLMLNYFTQWTMLVAGHFFERVPLIKMLYNAINDLFNAFVGDNKHFNKPVLVQLMPDSPLRMVGFITNEDLSALSVTDQVAVFLPMSYNLGGSLCLLPRSAITLLKVPSGEVMKFIVSGGLSPVQLESSSPETNRSTKSPAHATAPLAVPPQVDLPTANPMSPAGKSPPLSPSPHPHPVLHAEK